MTADGLVNNPIFTRIVDAITPIVSVGVGSAVFALCTKHGLNPLELEENDLKVLKPALLDHYGKFWADRLDSIERQLRFI
jgi:hypothetical protein